MSGWSMGPGFEERVHQPEPVELALVGGAGPVLERVPDGAHTPDVIGHPGGRPVEGHREPALDMGPHLGAEAEVEAAPASPLEVPRDLRHREGAARERDRDVGADVQPAGRARREGEGQEGVCGSPRTSTRSRSPCAQTEAPPPPSARRERPASGYRCSFRLLSASLVNGVRPGPRMAGASSAWNRAPPPGSSGPAPANLCLGPTMHMVHSRGAGILPAWAMVSLRPTAGKTPALPGRLAHDLARMQRLRRLKRPGGGR